jgi:hypothetical protein
MAGEISGSHRTAGAMFVPSERIPAISISVKKQCVLYLYFYKRKRTQHTRDPCASYCHHVVRPPREIPTSQASGNRRPSPERCVVHGITVAWCVALLCSLLVHRHRRWEPNLPCRKGALGPRLALIHAAAVRRKFHIMQIINNKVTFSSKKNSRFPLENHKTNFLSLISL